MLKAFIFDLDGTLLDSLSDIATSINEMLAARGHPKCQTEVFRQMVGDGMEKLVERALPEHARDEETIRLCTAEYRALYDKYWNQETKPYPGIEALLDDLRARGIKLGVISNKAHRFTVPMCHHFFGEDRFDAILGARDEIPRKPAPDAGLEMAATLGLSPAECAYVGDSGIDMAFAKACGMCAIGVLWGFRDEAELRQHGADVLVSRAGDIIGLPVVM